MGGRFVPAADVTMPQGRLPNAGPSRLAVVTTACLTFTLVSAGCLSGFSEVLPPPGVSTLDFVCAILDARGVERVRLASYSQEGVVVDPTLALRGLEGELAVLSGRPASGIDIIEQGAPATPAGGWNGTTLALWGRENPFLTRSQVTLRVFWLLTLDHHDAMGLVAAPGVVALSETAIEAAALRLDQSNEAIARVALLHYAGHALGATNLGVPVQDPDLQVREGTPGHDADPASVLAAGWEDARSAVWIANATYDRYPDAAHADWLAARGPDGVCS